MAKADELVFELKGVTPTQISMTRMAEYLSAYAALLGAKSEAFFSEIREGSTCLAAKMPAGGVSTARKRIELAARGGGPSDARKNYARLVEMTQADRVNGRVLAQGGVVIHLARSKQTSTALSVFERGHITGRVSGLVDGDNGMVTMRLRPVDGGPLVYADAKANEVSELGMFFRKLVRVYGYGQWQRRPEGGWTCGRLEMDEVHEIEEENLTQAFNAIRNLDIEWTDDPFDGFEETVGSV